MVKVKVIHSKSSDKKFEKKINDFISNKEIKVLEFHYSVALLYTSVIIVYEVADSTV